MSNILFISPNPLWGGAATANLAIAKMLQEYGHNVIVNDEYLAEDLYDGVRIDHTPIHQKKFSNRKLLSDLISSNNIDCIVWSPLVAIYFYREIIKLKKRGIKQIAIVHSLSLTNNLKGRLMDFLVSLTLAKMSTIVYVSKFTLDSWNRYRAIRNSSASNVVIHNIVDLPVSKHDIRTIKPRIGFVGRLSAEKQPDVFCELSSNSDYHYCVYGDGPLMEELANKYPEVEFKGLCNDTNQIYSDIDILVMTSKFENCPMVILEAFSFGIPCVVPNVGGIPEIVDNGENGIMFNEYNPQIIKDAIKQIISDYSRYSNNCILSSKHHSPSSAIAKWERILE